MPRRHALLYALNAGGVDPEALTRVDLEKMRIAGEHPVENFSPRALGPLTLSPGSEMLLAIPDNDESRMLRFWRDGGGSYLLLLSPNEMRVVSNGAIVTVPALSSPATAVADGSWTDESDGAATAGVSGATLTLTATATASARLRQALTVDAGNQQVAHVLQIVVSRGPVYVRIGTTAGGSELMAAGSDAELDDGTHYLEFTPGAGTVYVDIVSRDAGVSRIVTNVSIEAAGTLVIPTPWATIDEIDKLRTWQSLDVIFAGTGQRQQQRIENRGSARSWGVAAFKTVTGPFVFGSSRITLTNGAATGNTTITASEGIFETGHVGALIEITHNGKVLQNTFDGADQTSDFITVIGVDSGRVFNISSVPDSFVGTLVLERSFEPTAPTVWSVFKTFANGAIAGAQETQDDKQDNVTVHYRFRVSAYTSGSVATTIEYAADSANGIARITARNSATQVAVETLRPFGNTTASRTWRISDWSNVRGWPRVPVIHDGRLHWFRDDMNFASIVDDFPNYDDEEVGESGPFTRSVGSGGESGVLWALSVDRLVAGTSRSEAVIAASELDGALTPTEYSVRRPSRRGSADIAAVDYDDGLAFVQRAGKRLFQMRRPPGVAQFEVTELSRLNQAAFEAGITRLAVQQQPDLRLYGLVAGSLAIVTLAHDVTDNLVAITTRSIAGATVEDVAVLPAEDQDDVYLITNRGGTRYVERMAKESAQRSKATCALLDGHKVLAGSVSSITGATHFAGETVQVWADGVRHADVTLDGSGVAALTGGPFARVVYGKSYMAKFLTVKLEHAAALGTALGQIKQVKGAALVLVNSCMDGIMIGPDAANIEALPEIINGAERTPNQFFAKHEMDVTPINSSWETDARFYLEVNSAEGPATIAGIVLDIETRDGAEAG